MTDLLHFPTTGSLAIEEEEPDYELDEDLTETRKELRERLLADRLLNDRAPLEFTLEFSGCGDDGNYYYLFDDTKVGDFLEKLVDDVVDWDWCNNDGGGGQIHWDVQPDKITVTGYWNEMVARDVDEKTF